MSLVQNPHTIYRISNQKALSTFSLLVSIRMTAESLCSWSQKSVFTNWTLSSRRMPCSTWYGGTRPVRRSLLWWLLSATHWWSSIDSWCQKSGTNMKLRTGSKKKKTTPIYSVIYTNLCLVFNTLIKSSHISISDTFTQLTDWEENCIFMCFRAVSSNVNNGEMRQAVICGPHPLAFTTGRGNRDVREAVSSG